MITKLFIPYSIWEAMRTYVAHQAPLEACGLLAGKFDQVEKMFSIRNQAQSPVRFRMEPQQQIDAFEWIESHELDLLSIFHSHPAGPEIASATDIAEAAYPVVHIIWAGKNKVWTARGFWIEAGKTHEVPLGIETQ